MAAGLRPRINTADGWVVFLDAAIVVDATRVVAHPMANGVYAQRGLLVDNVLLQFVLDRPEICQSLIDLLNNILSFIQINQLNEYVFQSIQLMYLL